MMMKSVLAGVAAAVCALGVASYAHDHGKKAAGEHDHGKMEKGHDHGGAAQPAGETVTLKGEVLDLACYMAHEGKGEKHQKCAKACLLGGAPAGILSEDGTVTLLVEDHGLKKPYKAVLELAGQKAEVTGKKFTRGGLTGVVVSAVKKG